MWWTVFLGLVIIENISAQNDTIGTETQNQLCCPCPPGWPGARPMDSLAAAPSSVDLGSMAPSPADAVARGANGVDDCPCRARDADSEGAASLFFPNAVRAFGNVVRPDPKEDPKPLLHPEVGLASSVLETLREATDEEYRDALERDAARAVTDVTSLTDAVITDDVPEEARRVVTIIVSPRDMEGSDDAMPEASHVQETRCIHSSLGNPRNSLIRAPVPRKGLDDILNLPLPNGLLHRRHDSNLAASNTHETVIKVEDNLNKILSSLKLRTQPNLLKLDPKSISENINNILSGTNSSTKAGKSGLDDNENENSNVETNLSDTPISSEVLEESENIGSNIHNENDAGMHSDVQDDLDCNTSPTNDQKTLIEKSVKNTGPLKSLLFARNNENNPEVPFPLKNLFKLRDVELVPLDILKNKPKAKIYIPSIKLDPLKIKEARDSKKISILFGKPSKINTDNQDIELEEKEKSTNIQTIPRNKLITTDILDAVPSPSDDNCVKLKPEADKSASVNMEELEDSLLNSSFETVESDNEKTSDSIDIKETDTDMLNIQSVENMQLKSSEIFSDEDSGNTEKFQIIDDTQVAEQEGDTQIISEEDISDVPPGSVDLSELNETEERSNSTPQTLNPLKTLEEIRRSVVDKLEALQKSNRNALDSIKHNIEEIPSQDHSDLTSPDEEGLRDISTSSESVTFQDLQKMSDSILMASENHEHEVKEKNNASIESDENKSLSEEISESEINNVLGIEVNEPKPLIDIKPSANGSESTKTACPSDEFRTFKQDKQEKDATEDNKNTDNDLDTLASDPIMDIFQPISLTGEPLINIFRPNSKSLVDHINDMGSKLRQSIAVQPTSLINTDDLNIFRMPSLNIPDISGLNANIPTLEEIRTRVSEILNGLARTASDDDDSSESDSEDFASDVKPVISTGTRSSEPFSVLSSSKPFEDINLDIIQLKPLPSLLGSSPLTPDLPGLNLNRYKARLALPKSLDLKPLNLASTLGSNGGLVGTSLTIGPEKKEKNGQPKLKSNSEFDTSRVLSKNNPTLTDITSTMHKNALNLLNIPKSGRMPTLQAGNVFEKIKSHAEDTVRSIHESLNPSHLTEIHNNVLKNANNLFTSSRNNLKNNPIDSVVDNLRSQTQNTIQHFHDTLHSPRVADLSSALQENTQNVFKSSKSSVETAVDNLRAQSENTFRNIQQALDPSRLDGLSDSIHKTAQNILKSAPITPTRNLLGSTMQVIPPINQVAGSLRSHTQNTLKNIQETLNAPSLSDISSSVQKSAQQLLKSPITNNRPEILRSTLQPSTTIDTVVDNLRSQTQNTMRNIQNSLNAPTLGDISATVQKHAQNLLESPVALSGRNAFKQVLLASPSINLAPHAEQIAKDLQKTLKATLNNSPIKELPPLPHPNDVIQILSDHHDDVNDKLYALHTDLTDRLESFHNEVTDPERLRSVLSPLGNRDFELFSVPLPMSSRSALKQAPMLQTRQPSVPSQRKPQRKQRKKPSTSSFKSRSEIVKPSSKGKGTSTPISSKIPSAASSPIPARVDRLGLSTTKKPLKLQDIKKPVFPKLKPSTKNKVPVTFGSTTKSPVAKSNRISPTTSKPKISTNERFKPKGPVRQPTPWNGWAETRSAPKRLGEPLTSPSRTIPNIQSPSKSKTVKPIATPNKTGLSSRLAAVSPKLKSQSVASSKPSFKSAPSPQGRASKPKPLGTLKNSKSPLLTKLTDALRSKHTHASLSQLPQTRSRDEMSPAASDNFEKVVALEEPLKQNVPYKCKMMCVKVDLNDE